MTSESVEVLSKVSESENEGLCHFSLACTRVNVVTLRTKTQDFEQPVSPTSPDLRCDPCLLPPK